MALIKEEQIKKDKNPFDSFEDFKKAAKEGFDSIAPDDFLRFKWFGVYQQKPKTDPYFLLRIKLPGGRINSKQLRLAAETACDYSKGVTDITTRQTFQFHWLTIENLPGILERFNEAGITTKGSCGDVTRGVTSSPLAGIEPDEVDDIQDVIEELNQILIMDKQFSNLPRKYKLSISGSLSNSSQPEINDVGVYGFWKEDGMEKVPRFAICVGGGLSRDPMFARKLPVALKREEIIPIVKTICGIFNEFGNRGNRREARLKFLVEEWGAEKVLEEIEKRMDHKFERCDAVPNAKFFKKDSFGVIQQKQDGLFAVGVSVSGGHLTADELFQLAELNDQYGSGEFRLTNQQNIILINIPEKNVKPLVNELKEKGFSLGENGIDRGVVACTGSEFCNLALVETKALAIKLTQGLAVKFPEMKETISIHVTGCGNACGQHQIADIGLMGVIKIIDGKRYEAFHVSLGGVTGENNIFARQVFESVLVSDLPDLLEAIISTFLEKRESGESFSSFCQKHSVEALVENIESS